MPDPQYNGRHEPGDADKNAAERLSRGWDAMAAERRVGGAAATATATDTTLVRLAELRAADTASGPRPGFLDHLERELMDASLPKTTVPVKPSMPMIAVLPGRRQRRRGRGFVDVMAVAAVVALLIAGSWSIWSQNTGSPGDGTHVPYVAAGSATPYATPDVGRDRLVALNRPWVTNADTNMIDGVVQVSSSDCTTPPRQPGSLVAAVEQANQTPTVTVEQREAAASATSPDISTLPKASADDMAAARTFFVQYAACRFSFGMGDNGQLEPYTGAFWNLFSTQTLANRVETGPRDPMYDGQTPEQKIDASYRLFLPLIENSAWPSVVEDVREVPARSDGARQLRVRFHAVTTPHYHFDIILVREDGRWRIATYAIAASGDETPAYQISNIDVGDSGVGPRGVSSSATQLERDTPVLMSLHNGGDATQSVSVDGQDIGTIAPGETVNILPFTIRSEDMVGDAVRSVFTVASGPAGSAANAADQRTLTIAVYPPGTLAAQRGGSTPSGTPSDAGTAPATPQTGVSAVRLDVSGLDYPAVPASITSSFIPASDCTTAPRAAGSVGAALATAPDSTDWTGGSSYFARGNVASQREIDALPDAPDQDHAAASSVLQQLVACRFTAGTESDGTASYVGPYWGLFSDDYFRFNKPTIDAGRTVTDPAVRPWTTLGSSVGTIPPTVVSVKQLPPDNIGQPRLLFELGGDIQTESGQPAIGVMVRENGVWRITQMPMLTSVSSTVMPIDLFITADGRLGGCCYSDNYNQYGSPYVPAGKPVLLDFYNASASPVRVTISGQELGTLQPGDEVRIAPFAFPDQPGETTSLNIGMSSPAFPDLHGTSFIADYGQSATPENRRYETFPPTPPADSTVPPIIYPSEHATAAAGTPAAGTPVAGTPAAGTPGAGDAAMATPSASSAPGTT